MRIYTSEFAHDYGTYSFGYTLHAALEENDNPKLPYESGFLPYSANPNAYNLLYMARSVRVPVKEFDPSSENRRVFKKFDGLATSEVVPREELANDAEFQKLFLDYFETRHGKKIMGEERLQGLLKTVLPLRGIRYRDQNGELIAAVFEPAGENWAHFWFPAYRVDFIGKSLGMWLMLDAIRRAAADGRDHLYLGTAYGEKARYKLNVPQLEFWDGMMWARDEEELKRRMKEDGERVKEAASRFALR
ncbi:MAG: hypothetical protein ABA06_04805 [Parcubacteria bacterium C7867-001]|nr:MAG: hypothetical protein ABA06_04805 [Parcubacteria bacterium C7867-001]